VEVAVADTGRSVPHLKQRTVLCSIWDFGGWTARPPHSLETKMQVALLADRDVSGAWLPAGGARPLGQATEILSGFSGGMEDMVLRRYQSDRDVKPESRNAKSEENPISEG